MSRVMKCDRCGAFYKPYNTLINPYYVGYNGDHDCHTVDLCPTCKDKLNSWMEVQNEKVGDRNIGQGICHIQL